MTVFYYKDGTSCECDRMVRGHYFSGALRSEIPIVNGRRHGIEKWYYESENLRWETPYIKGKSCGIKKCFYPSGALAQAIPHTKDRIHGIWKSYNENGTLAFVYMYVHGNHLPKDSCPTENFV